MSMPEPPWGARTRRNRAARTPLSTERIVDSALELIAEEGYDAVTMRRIAAALGTGPSSLYAHVASKRQLDQLLIDRIIEGVELPEPDPERWEEQVKEIGRVFLARLQAYPGVARAAIGNIPLGFSAMRASERLLGYLRAGGLPDRVVAYAADLLPLYINAVAFEQNVRASATGTDAEPEDFRTQLRDYFAAFPPDQFPNFIALADALVEGDETDRFEFGLDVLVSGLAAVAARDT
jgi:AcrR family transcriptional regulator